MCYLDCTQIAYTSGNFDRTTCICINERPWNSTTNCSVDCSVVPNSTSMGYEVSCACNKGFSWSSINLSCDLSSCSEIENAVGGTVVDGTCGCSSNFYWSSSGRYCTDCPQSMPEGDPRLLYETCSCWSSHVGNTASQTCFLDCSQIEHAVSAANETSCRCDSGYNWNDAKLSCDKTGGLSSSQKAGIGIGAALGGVLIVGALAVGIAVAVGGRRAPDAAQGGMLNANSARVYEAGVSTTGMKAVGTSTTRIGASTAALMIPPTTSVTPTNSVSRRNGTAVSIPSKGVVPSFVKVLPQNDEISAQFRK